MHSIVGYRVSTRELTMTLSLAADQISYFRAKSGEQISKSVAESLIENYCTRAVSRQIREPKRNALVTEMIYQLGDSGLEVGHHKGWDGMTWHFTIYYVGEGSAILKEARASLGI